MSDLERAAAMPSLLLPVTLSPSVRHRPASHSARRRSRRERCRQAAVDDELIVAQSCFSALGKAVHEHAAFARSKRDDRPVAARATLARTRNPLLDHTTAKVGVDETLPGSSNCLPKLFVADPLLARKARELLRLEDPHKDIALAVDISPKGVYFNDQGRHSSLAPDYGSRAARGSQNDRARTRDCGGRTPSESGIGAMSCVYATV